METDPEIALNKFMEKLTKLADKHAPLRKRTARHNSAPWLSDDLKALMTQCDNAKKVANLSGCLKDRETYCKLRNVVTKLNKNTKREHYQQKLSDAKNNSKEIWKTLNEIMRRKSNMGNTYVDCEGVFFITKPQEIANYFNDYFINKIEKLRATMSPKHGSLSHVLIENIRRN